MADDATVNVTVVDGSVTLNVTAAQGPAGPQGLNGGPIIYGAGVPDPDAGQLGDTYIDTVRAWLYEKTALSTWTHRAILATAVTNTHVHFVCPDGVTRRATLTNIP